MKDYRKRKEALSLSLFRDRGQFVNEKFPPDKSYNDPLHHFLILVIPLRLNGKAHVSFVDLLVPDKQDKKLFFHLKYSHKGKRYVELAFCKLVSFVDLLSLYEEDTKAFLFLGVSHIS